MAIKLRAHYVVNELTNIGNLEDGAKIKVRGTDGETKWINVTLDQLERMATIMAEDQPPKKPRASSTSIRTEEPVCC